MILFSDRKNHQNIVWIEYFQFQNKRERNEIQMVQKQIYGTTLQSKTIGAYINSIPWSYEIVFVHVFIGIVDSL